MSEREPAAPTALTEADAHGCRWISGEPSPIRSGLWCCKPTVPGSAYCQVHRDRAWTPSRRRRPASQALPRPVLPLRGLLRNEKEAPQHRIGSSWQQPY
jgi:hypothetical protein